MNIYFYFRYGEQKKKFWLKFNMIVREFFTFSAFNAWKIDDLSAVGRIWKQKFQRKIIANLFLFICERAKKKNIDVIHAAKIFAQSRFYSRFSRLIFLCTEISAICDSCNEWIKWNRMKLRNNDFESQARRKRYVKRRKEKKIKKEKKVIVQMNRVEPQQSVVCTRMKKKHRNAIVDTNEHLILCQIMCHNIGVKLFGWSENRSQQLDVVIMMMMI